jgi:predicted Zn finger-like uncharacterized protein
MQIQCPHCKSRYRLGSEMIDAFGGFVRCGSCNYKFNIHDQVILDDAQEGLFNTSTRPAQHKDQATLAGVVAVPARVEPRLERDQAEDEFNIRFGPDDADEYGVALPEAPETREPQLPSEHNSGDDDIARFQFPDGPDELDDLDESENVELDDTSDELDDPLQESGSSDDESNSEIDDSWPELGRDEESIVFGSLKDAEVEDDSSRLVLINDAQDTHSEPGFFSMVFAMLLSATGFVFWMVAAIALAYLLFEQVSETLYPAYKNHSLVQQARSVVCAKLPCDNAKENIDLFEIVVSRMDEINQPSRQLHISIFLLNQAEHAQAYPNILLTLKTLDGSTVGQRVVRPDEYFTSYDSLISSSASSPIAAEALVKPNKLGKILIKLDKPPVNAVGFEARVVQ